MTASFFKNEECFIKLCKENGKTSGNCTRVIVFKESCVFSHGPDSVKVAMQGGLNYGATSCFAGGQNPISNVNEINKKQFEYDF